MKHFIKPLGALSLLLLIGCQSVPPQVVTSAETLKSYSGALGDSSVGIVNHYNTRLDMVSKTLMSSSHDYLDEYEKDVNSLASRMESLQEDYDLIAEAMNKVLEQPAATQRSAMLNASEEKRLHQILDRWAAGSDRRDEIEGLLSATTDPEGFKEARKMLHDTQGAMENQNAQIQNALVAKIKEENTTLADAHDVLINYLRSLVKVTQERKRMLGNIETTAEKISGKVGSSDTLSKVGNIFKAFSEMPN